MKKKSFTEYNRKKRLLNRQSNIKNWEKKYNDSKAKLDALNKSYEDMTKGFDAMGNATKKTDY